MNATQLRRLAVLLGALVVVWAVLALVRRAPNDSLESLSMPAVDTSAVDSVRVVRGPDSVSVVRAGGGNAGGGGHRWQANGFAADSGAVQDLLAGLADRGTATELAGENRASHAGFGVDAAGGLRVRVFAHGKALLDLVSGKRTPDYSGVYFRQAGRARVYAMHGRLVDAITKNPDAWRDKLIASTAGDSIGAIEVKRGASSYIVRRNGKTWTVGSRAADSAAVDDLIGAYRDVRADGFATRSQSDSIGFAKPTERARVLSRGTGAATLADLSFDSTATGVWVRSGSGGPVYRIDGWTLNQLAPPESTLVAKPKPRKPAKK